MAYPTEPRIEIDDLAPHDTLGGYHATWQEGGMIAHAYLEPIDDQPARGYALETTYQTVSGREPGLRQRNEGALLTASLRARLKARMFEAGWRPISEQVWQHESRLNQPLQVEQDQTGAGQQEKRSHDETFSLPSIQKQRTLQVPAREGERKIKSYSRTITATPVTFTCSRCHREATRSQYPGRVPRYCEPCAAIIKREKTRERVARLRAGQKAGREVETPTTTDEDRKQILLRKRGDGTYRIHQVEVDRWTAEARSPLTRGKWIPLSDEKLRIRLFASIDEAFQAVEANRRDMEALHFEMEEYSKRNAN